MSGVKGRSGGPRENSGGVRPGAGRKPNPPAQLDVPAGQDPLDFLLSVMDDRTVDAKLRVRAAVAAAQYVHPKKGEGGKKDERQAAAEKAGRGKFAPPTPPKLVVNNT